MTDAQIAAAREVLSVETPYHLWLLERFPRTSNTLTEWCNVRLANNLPAFCDGWWKHD